MPNPEYEKLVSICHDWINDDAEYIFDCSLKKDAPEYIKQAFERLKEIHKEFQDEHSITDV